MPHPLAPRSDRSRMMGAPSHRVHLSGAFMLYSLLAVTAASFGAGRLWRSWLAAQQLLRSQTATTGKPETATGSRGGDALPPILYPSHEPFPATAYSARHFDTSFPATQSSVLARKDYASQALPQNTAPAAPTTFEYPHGAGRHVLLDLRNVDPGFLDDAGRLSEALLRAAARPGGGGLQVLSVHCHALVPTGVTCVGVALQGHLTFHTWPAEGVILLDLLTFQGDESQPAAAAAVVASLEAAFGVPAAVPPGALAAPPPASVWALKRRGFREETSAEQRRYERLLLGSMLPELKRPVLTTSTPQHAQLEIFDVVSYPWSLEDYEKSLDASSGSYEATHAEIYQPDRLLVADGVLRARRHGAAPFYEALVHPALLAHPHPRRVVVVGGGGTGAALREVLKHRSVESVLVVEQDAALVEVARTHLPGLSDCRHIVGGTESCFDDPRVTMEFADNVEWLLNNRKGDDKFDVVLLDVDPMALLAKSNNTGAFLEAVHHAMTVDGVLVSQLPGASLASASKHQSPAEVSATQELVDLVKKHGFQVSTGGVPDSWTFLMALKNHGPATRLPFSGINLALKLRSRLLPGMGDALLLHYIDGATQFSFPGLTAASSAAARCPELCRGPHSVELSSTHHCLEGCDFLTNATAGRVLPKDPASATARRAHPRGAVGRPSSDGGDSNATCVSTTGICTATVRAVPPPLHS